MTRSLLLSLIAATLTLAAAVAQADTTAVKDGHFFVDAGFGYGYIHTRALDPASPFVVDATSYTSSVAGLDWNAGFGYLWYTSPWAYGGRLGYSTYHDSAYTLHYADGTKRSIRYTDGDIDLLALGKFFFTERFAATLEAGVAYVMQRLTITPGIPGVETPNHYRFAPSVGLKLSFGVTDNLGVTLESRYTLGEIVNINKPTWAPSRQGGLRSTNLGLTYTL